MAQNTNTDELGFTSTILEVRTGDFKWAIDYIHDHDHFNDGIAVVPISELSGVTKLLVRQKQKYSIDL